MTISKILTTAQERAKEKNETVQLVTIDNAAHFELIAPWTEPGREVVRQIVGAARARKSVIEASQ